MTERNHVFLVEFQPSELIFDEEETKDVLKFFFVADHPYIDSIVINDRVRNLAQGLLVEAVDASFAMGFVKSIYDTFYLKPPTLKIKNIFNKLGKKSAMHWIKHATATDLKNIKIYESVRSTIAKNFRRHFMSVADGLVMTKPHIVVIAYTKNVTKLSIIWGAV